MVTSEQIKERERVVQIIKLKINLKNAYHHGPVGAESITADGDTLRHQRERWCAPMAQYGIKSIWLHIGFRSLILIFPFIHYCVGISASWSLRPF